MVKKSFSEMSCSLAQAMDVIGEWWTMLIIRDFFLGNGHRRFEQLRDSLGISRNILTERLKTLTEAGVIERVPLQEGGRRHGYQLTEKGSDLLPAIVAITQWWEKWQEPNSGPWGIRDREYDEEIAPITVQSARGKPLSTGDMYMTAKTSRGEFRIREWPPRMSQTNGDDLEQVSQVEFNNPEVTPAHPSATVVLVREAGAGLEVLMVRRSRDVKHMGGMWVFPGGRVDAADGDVETDAYGAALNAAIRETKEEAGLRIAADHLYYISHWTTPEGAKKRFATWFFVGVLEEHQDVMVDGGEIAEHRWITPAAALAEQANGELRLMPPTYITLLELESFGTCERLRRDAPRQEPVMFAPRVTQLDEALHFLYDGDAGFHSCDPSAEGRRHRCIMVGDELTYLKDF